MHVTELRYKELRSTGNYGNLELGVTVALTATDDPSQALALAKTTVQQALDSELERRAAIQAAEQARIEAAYQARLRRLHGARPATEDDADDGDEDDTDSPF